MVIRCRYIDKFLDTRWPLGVGRTLLSYYTSFFLCVGFLLGGWGWGGWFLSGSIIGLGPRQGIDQFTISLSDISTFNILETSCSSPKLNYTNNVINHRSQEMCVEFVSTPKQEEDGGLIWIGIVPLLWEIRKFTTIKVFDPQFPLLSCSFNRYMKHACMSSMKIGLYCIKIIIILLLNRQETWKKCEYYFYFIFRVHGK